MRGLLIVLMECSVTMSVLALCFIALTPRLSKRYASKWLYYGWLVIVIGLIIPFRLHPDTPLIHKDLFANTAAVQQTASDRSGMMEQGQDRAGTQGIITGDSGAVPDDQKTASGIIEQILHSPWYLWAGALWIFGAILFIAFHGVRHRRFLQMVRRWSQKVSNQQTLDILQDQKLGLGISKRVELWTCACITSPMMIGLVNPVILLPQAEYSEGELSLILRHELVHIQRKDLWYKILVFFATAIHWFNPVVYLMAKAIAVQCEISCDMEVVKETDLDRRQQYSETILNVIRNKTGMQTAFSTNFYGSKKEMKKRIFSIMDRSKKKTGIFILCAVLILTLGSGVVFAAGADNTEDTNSYTVEVYNDTTQINLINKPFIQDGELYLPLRETLNAFGIDDIQYNDGEIQIVTPTPEIDNRIQALKQFSTNVFEITIGSPKLKSPDRTLRTAPMLKNDTTYVPLDFFDMLITNGQIPRFRVQLIQPSDPSVYYSEGEEVFIGTASEQDSYNPVDENGNRKLVKRIITNENGEVVALVTVENQRPEMLSKLWNTEATKGVMPDFESILRGSLGGTNAYGEIVEFQDGVFIQKDGKFIAYIPPAYLINRSTTYSISYRLASESALVPAKGIDGTENATPSAAAVPAERTPKKAAEVPAEPVTEDALPAMGALNIKGMPYLPLVKTAEDLGYTVNVSSFKIADKVPDWDPQYPDAVEYNYELSKDGKSVGIASLDISDGKVISSMLDQIFCNTHDRFTSNSFVFQDDTVYMPAQFFKEALDTDNKLP